MKKRLFWDVSQNGAQKMYTLNVYDGNKSLFIRPHVGDQQNIFDIFADFSISNHVKLWSAIFCNFLNFFEIFLLCTWCIQKFAFPHRLKKSEKSEKIGKIKNPYRTPQKIAWNAMKSLKSAGKAAKKARQHPTKSSKSRGMSQLFFEKTFTKSCWSRLICSENGVAGRQKTR